MPTINKTPRSKGQSHISFNGYGDMRVPNTRVQRAWRSATLSTPHIRSCETLNQPSDPNRRKLKSIRRKHHGSTGNISEPEVCMLCIKIWLESIRLHGVEQWLKKPIGCILKPQVGPGCLSWLSPWFFLNTAQASSLQS